MSEIHNLKGIRSMLLIAAAVMFVQTLYTSAANAQTRAWTGTPSTATVKEDSLSIAYLNRWALGFDPVGTSTGTITARMNITATAGVSSFCAATSSTVKVRFRDSDGAANAAQITFDIHATNIDTGADSTIFSFNSNTAPAAGSGFQTTTSTPAIDFDFSVNIYWIEIKVRRDNTSVLGNIGVIQISETAGVACP